MFRLSTVLINKKFYGDNLQRSSTLHPQEFAKGIYQLFSLMVVMALPTLKKECCFSPHAYHGDFTSVGTAARQAKQADRYNFKCAWVACEQDWPITDKLLDRELTLMLLSLFQGVY